MASKGKRQAQKARLKQRQQKKRERRGRRKEKTRVSPMGVALRQAERLARQKPSPWAGEAAEDVAVFDEAIRETLPEELAAQALAVREGLELALASRADEANARVAEIPRSSPYSQWRLFIRGLAAWLESDQLADSRTSWDRLDHARRPGRIAVALIAAHRKDLDSIHIGMGQEEPLEGEAPPLDAALLYAAKLVRRTRLERKAIAHALHGATQSDEDPELQFGPRKIGWLRKFTAEYTALEPELVRALHSAAAERIFAQSYTDLLDEFTRSIPGPPHDRRYSLLKFYFYEGSNRQRAESSLRQYLDRDLPANQAIPERLRNALMSQAHLNAAQAKQNEDSPEAFFFSRPTYSAKEIEPHFVKAIAAYPANAAAHKKYADFLADMLDGGRLTKVEANAAEERLVKANVAWSTAIPDAVEPRLWLVDHYLEHEELSEAKPHVDWLRNSRHEDPRVRATPWKWNLLEASRLCRRKAWLAEAGERLAQAESLWPVWLSRAWLPYLKAAQRLRSGDEEAFQQLRPELGAGAGMSHGSLVDACMMLGAAQLMRVPAAALKPLRASVDEAVKGVTKLPISELIDAGDFFWDLHRTALLYPSYRRHGSKFGRELLKRIKLNRREVASALESDRFQNAVLWLSEHGLLTLEYGGRLPGDLDSAAMESAKLSAAAINAALGMRFMSTAEWRDRIERVREAAPAQADPYYRYWFASLANEMEEALAANPYAGGMLQRVLEMMGDFQGYGDDDDDDEGLDFDPDCDCPSCRAARKAAGVD